MIQTTTICPACGDHIELSDRHRWIATCMNQCAVGLGETPEDALTAWTQDAADIQAAALSSLATFIVPEPPEGYGLTVELHDDVLGSYIIYPASLARAVEHETTVIHYGPLAQKAANQ